MKSEEVRMKNGLRDRTVSAVSLILETLREIFDENAYRRFLLASQMKPSRASYAAFLHENSRRRERRARCC